MRLVPVPSSYHRIRTLIGRLRHDDTTRYGSMHHDQLMGTCKCGPCSATVTFAPRQEQEALRPMGKSAGPTAGIRQIYIPLSIYSRWIFRKVLFFIHISIPQIILYTTSSFCKKRLRDARNIRQLKFFIDSIFADRQHVVFVCPGLSSSHRYARNKKRNLICLCPIPQCLHDEQSKQAILDYSYILLPFPPTGGCRDRGQRTSNDTLLPKADGM